MESVIRVIITGGGSGGHTMPAISMVDSIKKYCEEINEPCEILYIGSNDGIEKKIAQKHNVNYKIISTGKFRRYFSFDNFFDIFKVLNGVLQSYNIISKFKPDIIFSTGGFVSVPPVIAAKLHGKKIIIHEQTVDAGLANRISSRFANKIALTFEESKKYFAEEKVVVTGIPLRPQLFASDKKKSIKLLGISKDYPTLYFSGGGLGCHLLNKVALEIVENLLEKTNIIFQTGNAKNGKDYLEMLKFRESLDNNKKSRFKIYNFINDEIGDIYSVADLVISRSGAGTVNELIALRKPAIFIPLAIAANNEQWKNAEIMSKIGGAIIIDEENLTETNLTSKINEILFSDQINIMRQNLEKIENFKGNENLVKLVFQEMGK